ncbi:molybdenum cofactor sulfurase, partial [Selaginella moellendorffii]|uniref:molybdenum cofactor sulfurase n=1 Tax=Selaginella moellendorffii TaxID=88036 RepID=UPI000D1CC7B3
MPSLLWQLHHSDDGSNLEISPGASSSKNHGSDDLRTIKEEEEDEQEEGESSSVPPARPPPPSSRRTPKSVFTRAEDLPGLESALASFLAEHPSFESTSAVDETRESDYPHLRAANRACFDYCGFGLFSFTQRFTAGRQRSSFSLVSAGSSGSLAAQAAFATTEPNTLQSELRSRVLDYLNVGDGSYSAVFTASKRAAFALVADCYDFRARSKLVTVYDHESESVKALTTAAVRSGGRTCAARFRWPTLRLCGEQLAAELKTRGKGSRLLKKKTGTAGGTAGGRRRGLFVFPTQSRITGTKYSYQWMTMAEKHRWDVLLDVSAMGPRDMGSLGLSLFRPDFIICSFYKIFGSDPTGFGCLLIKDSSMASLRSSSSSPGIGMVRVVPDLGDDEELAEDLDENVLGGRPSSSAAAARPDLIA